MSLLLGATKVERQKQSSGEALKSGMAELELQGLSRGAEP